MTSLMYMFTNALPSTGVCFHLELRIKSIKGKNGDCM